MPKKPTGRSRGGRGGGAGRRRGGNGERLPRDLQAAIDEQGYTWQAGITELSELPEEQQAQHLGLVVSDEEIQAMAATIQAATTLESLWAVSAPASIDWRNHNGANWITPVKDQQTCGSCVAFATAATLEARLRIVSQNAALTTDLSEAHLFYCGCGNCCANGWNFPPALDFCKNTGVALETAFPYTPNNQPCPPNLTSHVKLTAWTPLFAVPERKNILATKGPVIGGMAVYQDFYAYRSGVYRRVSDDLTGYHAIAVVGYDDAQGCWICKNSWGTNWGEQGFFRIAYGEAGIDSQFAFYDVDLAPPATECEQYVPALRQILTAARGNPMLRVCLRYHVCRRGMRPWYCPPSYRQLASQIDLVLERCPAYRPAFCRALG